MKLCHIKSWIILGLITSFCGAPLFSEIMGPGVDQNPWVVPQVLKNGEIQKRIMVVKEFIVLKNRIKHLTRSRKVEEKIRFGWQDLRKILMQYQLVPEYIWKNEYNHTSGMDIEGYIRLKSRERIRWLVRPGGLACVVWENGTVIYLAKVSDWPVETGIDTDHL